MRAGLESGNRQRHALDERLEARLRCNCKTIAHVERGRAGEEGGRVPVRAEAEQDEIEWLALEGGIVSLSRFDRRPFRRDRMHRRHDDEPFEKGFAYEQLIRTGIVGRNATVVAEPEVGISPVGVSGRRELVGTAGGGAARENDRPARVDHLDEERRGCACSGLGVLRHDELDVHAPIVPHRTSTLHDMNMTIVRRSYEAFARGDLDAVVADMDEAIEWQQAQGLPHGGTYRGLAEVRANVFDPLDRDWWSAFSAVPDEFLEAGDEVVVLGRYRGTAKQTGKALDVPFVHVWSLRDGKAWRFRQFLDTAGWVAALTPES